MTVSIPPRRRGSRARALAAALLGLIVAPLGAVRAQECSLDAWAEDVVGVWLTRGRLTNAECYARLITSMDTARRMRDAVWAGMDRLYPRAGYKVVGLDPVNAALPGVDRPMVGALYVPMFVPSGATIPLDSAAVLITEPDILISIKDEGVNDATTLEEALPHLDRVFAFIEVLSPIYDNSPPNPFLMQASNVYPRWGVIGENVVVEPTPEFLRSVETMRVTFVDGDGAVLADVPGSYLGRNPLNGVLVVVEELKRRGERLMPGDLVSSGSFRPPIPVRAGLYTETVYEGIGGTTLRVSASYR